MKNVNLNKNSTVQMFTKLRQNEDLTFKELFNILRDKMVNLISYFPKQWVHPLEEDVDAIHEANHQRSKKFQLTWSRN